MSDAHPVYISIDMNIFEWYRGRKARIEAAAHLYDMAVTQSRLPAFYEALGVTDSIDGRFDLLTVHIFLIMDRLGALGPEGRKTGQALFDRMFRAMELNLREAGVGDLGVPKHIKKMMKAFNGRLHSYAGAISAQNPDALQLALTRNVYRAEGEAIPAGVFDLTDYVLSVHRAFESMTLEQFQSGQIWFPPVLAEQQRRKEALRA